MRIVSLLSSATEILFALGLGKQVVAISHECHYPREASMLPRATCSLVDSSRPSREIDQQVRQLSSAGAALYEIDRDLIRRFEPDLIVTQAQCDVCAVRYQDVIDFVANEPALAKTRVVALSPQSLGGILEDVLRVGDAASELEAAKRYVGELAARIRRIAARSGVTWKGSGVNWRDHPSTGENNFRQLTPDPLGAASPPPVRPRVVCLEWLDPLMAAGNWTPELIELAGGVSCLAAAGLHSGYAAWEDVRVVDLDVLLIAPCGFDLPRSRLEARRLFDLPGFAELAAVASGNAFVIDGSAYLNRSGPRIVDSLEILAHLIRPDRFEPPGGEMAEGRAWSRLCS